MSRIIYGEKYIFSFYNTLKLGHAFIYLSKNESNKNTENIDLEYILTFNINSIPNFKKTSEIIINEYTFILWKNSMSYTDLKVFSDIFCIIQTSGTTGANKVIMIPQRCIETNALSLGKVFNINCNDVIFWGTPLSFDPSLIELLLALLNGATLLIVPYRTYINPNALFSALFNIAQVTVVQMVPSVFNRWDESFMEKIFSGTKLRVLAFGGEVFPKNVLKFNRKKDLVLFNLYGITELSCWATVHTINEESVDHEIPIGKCLEETIVQVKDENGKVIQSGEGEIYIGSNTRKCYIDNETEICLPIFRETGDIAYIEKDSIYYKGRKNMVIKRYGHRINLFKIEETILNKCHLTTKCVWSEKKTKLLIFILIKDASDKSIKEKMLDKIRTKLLHILPQECFPDYFEILLTFPTTLHGKIDERKLEEYFLMSLSNKNLEASDLFYNLWCKYLGINTKNFEHLENYSFFEMGGNSINVLQLISEFKDLSNIESTDLLAAIFEKKLSECKKLIDSSIIRYHVKEKEKENTKIDPVGKRRKIHSDIRILWKYDLKACVDGSPLVFTDNFNNIRIAAGSFCNIFVILCENGEEIFKDILTGSIESRPTLSPCKNFIYVGCYDGTMHCIDYLKKRRVWKFKTDDRIKCSAIFLTDGIRMVFGSYDKHVYCLSSVDGSMIWRTELNGSISANIIFNEKLGIFVTTIHGTCHCILESNGDIIWTFKCETPIFGTPCIFTSDELVIVPSVFGILSCLSAQNGELVWKFKSDGHVFSSLVKYEDYVVFGCHDKNVYILKISASNFTLVGKVALNGEISSTPYFYEKNNSVRIVTATNAGTIYLINFKKSFVIKEIRLSGEVFSSPVVHENKVFLGCRDNNLYCLSLD